MKPMNAFLLLLFVFCAGYLFLFKPQRGEAMDNENDTCEELTGRVVLPNSPDYEKARLVSNYYTSKDRFPQAIVYCQNTQDVQNAVKWARCKKIPIRVRSGGHNHEAFSTATDALVVDLSEMKELKLDKGKRTATAQPGVNNKQLYSSLFKEGFTHIGGTCSEVSIAGLVSSGGMGPLLRRIGLTIDSVISFDIVDAKGKLLHVTQNNEYKDLFWAIRGGGGGNFGILTSITIKVYPATSVTWFNIGWDWSQKNLIDNVILTWQEFFSKADRNWFSHLDVWSKAFPKDEYNKQPVKFLGVFWGTPEEARKALAPLIRIGRPKVVIEPVSWEKAMQYIEESTAVFVTDKPEYKSPGAFVQKALSPEAVKIITSTLGNSDYPLFHVLIFSLGGATADIPKNATAYYYRDARFFINYAIQWLKAEEDKEQKAAMDKLYQQLQPYTVGDYVGNPDANFKDYLQVYYGDNAKKLQCVKRKYDPENLFKFEQSVPPAPADWKCE